MYFMLFKPAFELKLAIEVSEFEVWSWSCFDYAMDI